MDHLWKMVWDIFHWFTVILFSIQNHPCILVACRFTLIMIFLHFINETNCSSNCIKNGGNVESFNNISVISWQSVLLVEDTRVLEKTTDLPQFTDKFYQTGYQLTTLVGMGTDCIGSWKSNHHMITMALQHTRPHNLKSEFQESFQLKHPFWTQMQDMKRIVQVTV
jgi:hypothetical protein